mmetsp:Transcript_67371/g.158909  ORF Transcript_67371/g.158909 Transcript_67371/m.158909 type:complete len:239 (-) Transcript_67371:205-921(-)
MLQAPVDPEDLASLDLEYYKNVQWVLDNEIDGLGLELTFSLETDVFGTLRVVELVDDGAQVAVTDQNKESYARAVCTFKLTTAIQKQIDAFLAGLHELVPHHLLSVLDHYELELLLCGVPELDVEDWRMNTEYNGYEPTDAPIEFFWDTVRAMDHSSRVLLLQFATGSSRVPLGGFAGLHGATGPQRFTISRHEGGGRRLPTASTCFNLLKLPPYSSATELDSALALALSCSKGFDFT